MNDRIDINANVQHGRPVIKGTRVPVTRVLAAVAGGMDFAEIRAEYGVTDADIRAAVAFANDAMGD